MTRPLPILDDVMTEKKALSIVIDDTSGYRSCGSCNLCCTLQGVQEIRKPINVRCEHLNALGRCGCYSTRPGSCREYKCLWLQGYLPENMKPVRSRAVLEHNATGDMFVMRVLPQDKDHITKGILGRFLRGAISNKIPVIVVCGEKRWIYGARDKDLQLMAQGIGPDGQIVYEELTFEEGEL